MDVVRPREGRLDVRHDVVTADMFDELGAVEERGGLMARAAEDQRAAGFLQAIAERLQRMQP